MSDHKILLCQVVAVLENWAGTQEEVDNGEIAAPVIFLKDILAARQKLRSKVQARRTGDRRFVFAAVNHYGSSIAFAEYDLQSKLDGFEFDRKWEEILRLHDQEKEEYDRQISQKWKPLYRQIEGTDGQNAQNREEILRHVDVLGRQHEQEFEEMKRRHDQEREEMIRQYKQKMEETLRQRDEALERLGF